MMHNGYAHIYTIGCQMNLYDSEKLYTVLKELGYEKTELLDEADIVVCNTCSIRQKAQDKAFSFLGRMAGKKKKKPHLITIMAGCVAQQEKDAVFKRVPGLDIVLGTQAVSRLARHIKSIQSGDRQITDVDGSDQIFETLPFFESKGELAASRFVTIMQGCDNYCTYCVVPYVRGRERSRTPQSIVKEISSLADSAVKEVVLLGQNVNSYGQKEKICSFAQLLEKIAAIDGIKRIRFATSHPKDLSDELICAIQEIPKVCNHLHLPVQSGSDAVLKKMNRGYTRATYLERITSLRQRCPGIALTSDMIVGFPSETRWDFQQTLSLVRDVEFDGLFAFAYSDRPNAPAAKFPDAVDEKEKMARLNELLDFQETITKKKNQAMVGNIETVLVEGHSLKKRHQTEDEADGRPQMSGRCESAKIVHFCAEDLVPGDLVSIKIDKAYPHSLWGILQEPTNDEK